MNERPVQPSAFRLSPARCTPVIDPRPFVWRDGRGRVYTLLPEAHDHCRLRLWQPWLGPVPIPFDEYGDL